MSWQKKLSTSSIISSLLCNMLVWYDYSLYGSMSSIIVQLFTPQPTFSESGILFVYSLFAATFFMRPLGAVIFGHLGDRYGRKFALTMSVSSMSIPIALIAVLPTYQSIGILSPILLIIARLMQGLAAGGEASVATFFIECAPKNRKAFFASFEVVSAMMGSALCGLIVSLLQNVFGSTFTTFGWRIAFVIGLLMSIISGIVRMIGIESPEYEQSLQVGKTLKNPLKILFKSHKKSIAIALGIDALGNSSFYMFFTFLATYITNFQLLYNINTILTCILTLVFASLSDRLGYRKILTISSMMWLTMAYPVLFALNINNGYAVAISYFALAMMLSTYTGSCNLAISNIFPVQIRYTGYGISRNVASAIFGGTTPLICTYLIQITHNNTAPAIYVMLCAVISIACLKYNQHQKL